MRPAPLFCAAMVLAGCAADPAPSPSADGPVEIAWLALNRNGDSQTHFGFETGRPSVYVLLYNEEWMKTRTYGGPFEAFARKHRIPVMWRRLEPDVSHHLCDLLWSRGFPDLAGSGDIDWTRLEAAGASAKVLVVTRGDVRHAFLFDEVSAAKGSERDDYRDCEDAVLDAFNKSQDPPLLGK